MYEYIQPDHTVADFQTRIESVVHPARIGLLRELDSAGIQLKGVIKPDVWYIRGSMPDSTFKLRLVGSNTEGVVVREQSDGWASHIEITDTGLYRDAPMTIDVQKDVGILKLGYGTKTVEPVRIITDSEKHREDVRFGLRTRAGAKLIVFVNGASGRFQTEDRKAILIHRSEFKIVDHHPAAETLRGLVAASKRVSIGRANFQESNLAVHCRVVYHMGKPVLLWVMPSTESGSHTIMHETSDARRILLAYTRYSLVRTFQTSEDGQYALTDGSLRPSDTAKDEQVIYPFGQIPKFAVGKQGLYPLQDFTADSRGVPVVFQGCAMKASGQIFLAAEIADQGLLAAMLR